MKYSDQIELYTDGKTLPEIASAMSMKNYPAAWYVEQIDGWMGIKTTFDTDALSKFTFSYLIQNVIKAERAEQPIDPDEIVQRSICDAAVFIAKNPYIFAKPESEDSPTKRSGPSKKERAGVLYTKHIDEGRPAVIAAMMTELEMTKQGAGTYYNNFKKGKWEL